MLRFNKHLSSEERDKITILQGEGLSIRKIAKELGRSPITISRKLKIPNAMYYRGKYIGSQTDKNVRNKWRENHLRPNTFLMQKGTNFATITDEEIAYVEDWINNRPMKILNYMTLKQKLQHFSVAIAS